MFPLLFFSSIIPDFRSALLSVKHFILFSPPPRAARPSASRQTLRSLFYLSLSLNSVLILMRKKCSQLVRNVLILFLGFAEAERRCEDSIKALTH